MPFPTICFDSSIRSISSKYRVSVICNVSRESVSNGQYNKECFNVSIPVLHLDNRSSLSICGGLLPISIFKLCEPVRYLDISFGTQGYCYISVSLISSFGLFISTPKFVLKRLLARLLLHPWDPQFHGALCSDASHGFLSHKFDKS